jgi:hypothetical protein
MMTTISLHIRVPRGVSRFLDAFEEGKVRRDGDGKFTKGGASEKAAAIKRVDSAPSVPEDQRWLSEGHYSTYTKNPDEVSLRDLGVKLATRESDVGKWSGRTIKNALKYEHGGLQMVPLDRMHFYQPSVNKEKLKHFIEHYDLDPKDVHTTKELRKYEAPAVTMYPDGTMSSADHHRLVAAILRGDSHALARVSTLAENPDRTLKWVKTKSTVKQ